MTTFEMISVTAGGIIAFFSVGGLGYKFVVTWRDMERERGRAEQYHISSTETIEDLRTRLMASESRPARCPTCPLWKAGEDS